MSNLDCLTIEEQEEYLHFLFCKRSLSDASKLFKEIKETHDHPLAEAAFGYGLMQYAAPYTVSKTITNRRLILCEDYIPEENIQLHREIMKERHQLHAHMDLSIFNPQFAGVEEIDGVVYSAFRSNHIIRFSKISKISEIVCLVDDTLANLHKVSLIKEREILAKKPY